MSTTTTEQREPFEINGKPYNPDTEYYCVDYKVKDLPRWVRSPFNTMGEVQHILETLPYKENEQGFIEPNFHSVRITPEKHLDRLHQSFDSERDEAVDSEISCRAYHFGGRYEHIAETFTGSPSLSRQREESREDWIERVKPEYL